MDDVLLKLKKISDEISSEKVGSTTYFFALVTRTDSEGKWDLLISANWLEKSNSERDLIYVIDKLKEEFTANLDFLSQIVLLAPEEDFIQKVARAFIDSPITPGQIGRLKIEDDFFIQIFLIASNFTEFNFNENTTTNETVVVEDDF